MTPRHNPSHDWTNLDNYSECNKMHDQNRKLMVHFQYTFYLC